MKRIVVSRCSTLATLLFGSVALIACGGGDDDDGGDDEPITGTVTSYVNDTIKVPGSPTEVASLSFNLDGKGGTDNALGGIIQALKGQGVDIQMTVGEAVAGGDLIILHQVQADDLAADTSVGWKVYLGESTDTAPKYDGTDTFQVQAGQNPETVRGAITGGQFEGGPANVKIQLSLTAGTPIQVNLIGARIKTKVTATGCTDGVLGGAITDEELNGSVIPGIADLMNNSVKDDGAGGVLVACTMANDPVCVAAPNGDATSCDTDRKKCVSSTSKTILGLFDDDKDAVITAEEIKNDTLIQALLAPDVDMLNGTKFEPGVDGMKDSLSVGLGFTCKNATFTP